MGAAGRNDRHAIAAVDIGAFDRAVVLARHAHIRPVDVAFDDIDSDAVRDTAIRDNDLLVGSVCIHREHVTGAHLEKEQSTCGVLRIGFRSRFFQAR
jgi:hypothetical protein